MRAAYYRARLEASTIRIRERCGTPLGMDRQIIGNRFRIARESRGLSLRALSERSGLSFAYIQQIEKPRPETNVTLAALETLGNALDVSVDVVIGDDEGAEAAALVTSDAPARRALLVRALRALRVLDDEALDLEAELLRRRAETAAHRRAAGA